MARLSREFVKLETRIINDYRFFTMSEFEQLVYIKLLSISRSTSNQIPKKTGVLCELLRTKRSVTEVKSAVKRIKDNFPKFKENKYFYYFDGYELRLSNYVPNTTINSGVDEDEDLDKDKEGDKDRIKLDLLAPILYLNEKAKRNFNPKNKSSQDFIKARYNEGRTLEQFKIVIDKKVAQWLTNDKMMAYLRPSTLFSRTNFENYLNEPESADSKIKKLMEET